MKSGGLLRYLVGAFLALLLLGSTGAAGVAKPGSDANDARSGPFRRISPGVSFRPALRGRRVGRTMIVQETVPEALSRSLGACQKDLLVNRGR